jgi:glucarate dehydratase
MAIRAATHTDLRVSEMLVTPVACPDPPLLNHHGIHEPMFLRAIVRLLHAAARHVTGADPYHIEALRVLVKNPQVFSTIEVALLDLIGKATGRAVYDLLGGPARRRVPFAAYLFYKEEGSDEWGRALTPEELVRQAERFAELFGMSVFKVKGGVLEPDAEVAGETAARAFRPEGWIAHRSECGLVSRNIDPRRREAARHGPRVSGGSDRQH